MLSAGAALAQSTSYVYDANGRVVAVTASNGTSVQYGYNALGHTSQISAPLSPGQLAIFAFVPTHGEAGTQVTIQGQGFDSNAANDTVSFNGTVATVISATATTLVTTVPSGATTGPISVTVAGHTATSSTSFVVDDTGLPPSISAFTPVVAAVGGTVTVTGTHLAPVSGGTVLQVGGAPVAITAASDSQLQFVVPALSTGGLITVQTPYGQATSAQSLIVLPAAITPSSVVSSGLASPGSAAVNLVIGAAGQYGAVQFTGTTGSWLTLQLSNITTSASSIAYTVYGPGNAVVSQGAVSSGSPSIHLPQLVASGSYLAVFQPSNAGAQLSVSLETDAVLGAPSSFAAATSVVSQSKRMVFAATAGQNLELTFNGVSNPQAGRFVVYVYNTAGMQVAGFYCYNSNPGASCTQHLWGMPAGVYSIIVVPIYGGTIAFNTVLTADGSTSPLTINGTQSLTFGVGQVQRFNFSAHAGDTVALEIAGTTTPSAGITFLVYRPDAGLITASTTPYASIDTSSGNHAINLANLPISGTYTVIAAPDYGLAATGQLTLVPGVNQALSINGSAGSYATSASQQNVYLSFTAKQGEDLELTLNQVSVTGPANALSVTIYNAAGAYVTSFSCTGGSPSSCIHHLWNMAAGTYMAVVSPSNGGVINFNALLYDDIAGSALTTATPRALSLSAGQVERFTFHANAGDTLALNLSGITTSPAGIGVTVLVYRPDAGVISGGTAVYASFDAPNTPSVNLPYLPVTGDYTVIVSPDAGVAMNGQLTLAAGLVNTLSTNTQALGITTSVSMQNVYMTFTAQQGDNLEFTLNNLTNYLTVQVYTAQGQYVASFSCLSTGAVGCTQHLWNLNAGTYKITVQPYYGGTYSFNTLLQRDITGPSLGINTPINVSLAAGQVERFTFNASAGQTVALALSGVNTTPALNGGGVTFLVYRPDAGVIQAGTPVYTHTDFAGSQTLNLSNLPVSGTYTVIMAPDNGLPATAQLNLLSGITGVAPTNGTSQAYSTYAPGQNAYLSFTAQQGANLELTVNGLTLTGAGSATATVTVYNSVGTQMTSFSLAQGNPGSSGSVSLWNLQAGTYSVVVSTGGAVHFNVLLQPDLTGTLQALPLPNSMTLSAGQAQRYTFNASQTDTVTLQFSQWATTPSGSWLQVYVYRPDAGFITTSTTPYNSTNITPGNTQSITLSNLPMTGAYTVIVIPQYGLPVTAAISLLDAAGKGPVYGTPTLVNGAAPLAETGTAAGQNVTMAFNANQGDDLELYFNNINVAGASQNGFRVDVYDPSGNQVAWSYCYASNPGGGCRFALWDLVAGTYRVVVSPAWGGTLGFSAQIQPDATGPALAPNSPTSVTLPAGQVEKFTFNANAGDSYALSVSNVSTTPSGQPMYVNVYLPGAGPNPAVYASNSNSGFNTLNLSNLPITGTYTVVVYTTYGEESSATLTFLPAMTAALVPSASPTSVTTAGVGQNAYASFTASQGDNLELEVGNLSSPTASYVTANVQVFGPAGNQVSGATCYSSAPGGNCRLAIWNAVAGQYSVVVSPQSNVTLNFNAALLKDSSTPLAVNTPTPANLGLGQVQRFTFNANAGDTYALNLSGVGTTPGGQTIHAYVYRPDAGAITTGNYYTYLDIYQGSNSINLPNLPVSGAYTVVVFDDYGEPAQVTLDLAPGIGGQIPVNTPSPAYATSLAGQNGYFTFNANPGDNLELLLSQVVGTFNGTVYDQNGVQVTTFYCYGSAPGDSCSTPLWNLAGGTYSVIVTGPFGFNAAVIPDMAGPSLSLNSPAVVNLTAGQVERYTFNANQGDTVALTLANVATTPSGQSAYVYLYGPGVGQMAPGYRGNYYAQINTSSTQTINLPSLPVGGTYTVVVGQPTFGLPLTAQLTLTGGMTSSLSPDGTVQPFAASVWDENGYLSFTANPGDNLELALSNLSVPNNTFTSAVDFNVYDAQGRSVTTNTASCGTANCLVSLWNLAGGQYSVVVSPQFNGTMSFNALLTPDLAEPPLVANQPVTVTLPQGRVQRYTFNAQIGQSVALNVSGVKSSSTEPFYMNVYRPDTGAIVQYAYGSTNSSNYYAQLATSSSGTLNLPNLPVGGTYTLVVYNTNGDPASAELSLVAAPTPTLVSGEQPQSFVLSGANQSSAMTFAANAGDNLELTLNNIVASGGNNGTLTVSVYDANGNAVGSTTCFTAHPGASCNQPLWNLAAGSYSVVVAATQGGKVAFNAQLHSDANGGMLSLNTPVLAGPSSSLAERFTFSANTGGNVALQLSGIHTSPSGQPITVSVFRPDVAAITPGSAYQQATFADAGTLNLSSLPASGTYTVIVSTSDGIPGSSQLTLTSQ